MQHTGRGVMKLFESYAALANGLGIPVSAFGQTHAGPPMQHTGRGVMKLFEPYEALAKDLGIPVSTFVQFQACMCQRTPT